MAISWSLILCRRVILEWDTLCFFNRPHMKSFITGKFMNIDINEKRLCEPFFSLWFAVFIIFLAFGSVTSVLGINFEASDKPNKTALVCGTPRALEHLNQEAVTGDLRE